MLLPIENPDSWASFLATQGARFDVSDRVTGFHGVDQPTPVSMSTTTLVPLTHLAAICVSGRDASQFLQSQLTSDVRQVSPQSAQYSGYCTPKGRLLATFLLLQTENGYLLVLPRELVGAVAGRLRKFTLRAQVRIDEQLDSTVMLGLAGQQAQSVARTAFGVAPVRPLSAVHRAGVTLIALPGQCLLIVSDADHARPLWRRLADSASPAGFAEWEWRQLRAGVATVTTATQEAFLPQMINLEYLGGVSFDKGCYPGQEIVARTHYLGDLKRGLSFGRCRDEPRPADPLVLATGSAESVGIVVNAAPSPDGGWELLAVLARDAVSSGVRLRTTTGAQIELDERMPELPAVQPT